MYLLIVQEQALMADMKLGLSHDRVGVLQPAGHHELDGRVDLPAELQVCSPLISLGHEVQVPLRDSPQIRIAT